jgi:hypothetical protein
MAETGCDYVDPTTGERCGRTPISYRVLGMTDLDPRLSGLRPADSGMAGEVGIQRGFCKEHEPAEE